MPRRKNAPPKPPFVPESFRRYVFCRLNGMCVWDERRIEDGIVTRLSNTRLEWRRDTITGALIFNVSRQTYDDARGFLAAYLWAIRNGEQYGVCEYCGRTLFVKDGAVYCSTSCRTKDELRKNHS